MNLLSDALYIVWMYRSYNNNVVAIGIYECEMIAKSRNCLNQRNQRTEITDDCQ